MKKENKTLAIYGIKDIAKDIHPSYVHDHSLVLFSDGKIEKFIQLERKTKVKNDSRLDIYLYEILKKEGVFKEKNVDIVFVDNVIGRCFISEEGNIRFEVNYSEKLSNLPELGRLWWLDKKTDAYCISHELAHIGSCLPFYGEFKENSLMVHVDGGASISNFSAWEYRNNSIELLEHSWDLKEITEIWNSNALVFSMIEADKNNQNSVPGKLMGLASFGKEVEGMKSWLIKNDYFQNIWSNKKLFFEKVKEDWNISLSSFDSKNEFIQNIAFCLQKIFEDKLFSVILKLKERTNADYLYFSGGAALNINLNSKLLSSGKFKQVFIPPCPNDSGLAIGAGAIFEYLKHGGISKHSPYLNNIGLNKIEVPIVEEQIKLICRHLISGNIIGVCNGYGEVGPRALGNRSILALANSKKISKRVSVEIKGREWYRPIAPVMLRKNAEIFTGQSNFPIISKFMLTSFSILDRYSSELEGVVHVDGTSRIQIVDESDNLWLYSLLNELDKHGIKALINTSFNYRGNPIVHSANDAIEAADKMGLDALVIDGCLKKIEF